MRPVTKACVFSLVIALVATTRIVSLAQGSLPDRPGDAQWWKHEAIRFLQANLSETDSEVDPKALVSAVADFGANTFLMNMGGIVAQYPTRVPFHYPAVALDRALPITSNGRVRSFTLPRLQAYEVIVIE